MLKNVFSLLFLSILMPLSAAPAEYQAVRADVPPVIDGSLDEPCWKETSFHSGFKIMESDNPAAKPTEFGVVYTPNALIFGFRAKCGAEGLKALPANDPKTLFAECVEIMLDPTGKGETYYHFAVGANGALFDEKREQNGYVGDASYESGFTAAVRRGRDSWSAEISIPFRALELGPDTAPVWTFNAARESGELSSIAEKGRFNVGGAFTRLAAPQLPLDDFYWQAATPVTDLRIADGALTVTVTGAFTNRTGKERSIKLECQLLGVNGIPYCADPIRCRFTPGETRKETFTPLHLATPGNYECILTIRDRQSDRLLLRNRYPLELSFVPIKVRVTDPAYRNAIFATQKLDKVRFSVLLAQPENALAGQRLTAGIRRAGEKSALVKETVPAAAEQHFAFANANLPEGRLEIFIELADASGKVLAETVTPLRKLAYRKNEVWRDAAGNWYIDGQKRFLLLGWNDPDFHFPEYTAFMPGHQTNGWNGLFMSELGFGLTSAGIRDKMNKGGFTPEVEAFFRNRVQQYLKDEMLFAHYWVDEPDCQGMSRQLAAAVAAAVADEDPWHPVVISTGTNGVIAYPDCGELNGFHCYPNPQPGIPMSNFMKIVGCLDKAKAFFANDPAAQSIIYLHQGFNYGDVSAPNSRVPSYEEYRNQNLLALILGSRGLLHYNRTAGDYPEIILGMPELLKEQKIVGEKAIIQTPVTLNSPASELRLAAFRNESDGTLWLLACNAAYEPHEFTVDFPEFGNRKLQVLSETRSVIPEKGRFRDRFTPFQVHVYTTDQTDFKLKSIPEINRLIEDVYAKRAKPGNLAYQRFENSRLRVHASSNKNRIGSGPAENMLWHVTDGVIDPIRPGTAVDFCDNTPDNTPDWIELEFLHPATAGRIAVYPADNSLRNYEIQIRRNGQYQTVGKVENAAGKSQEIVFSPLAIDAVRIYITGTNGPWSKIREIEVYEK